MGLILLIAIAWVRLPDALREAEWTSRLPLPHPPAGIGVVREAGGDHRRRPPTSMSSAASFAGSTRDGCRTADA
jgi:hypothetical protein